jgi:hypothetical protein
MALIARTKDTHEIIIGTSESLLATAYVSDFSRNDDGTITFEYDGESKLHWDTQETLKKDGKLLFVTETYREVTEDEIELVEDDG